MLFALRPLSPPKVCAFLTFLIPVSKPLKQLNVSGVPALLPPFHLIFSFPLPLPRISLLGLATIQ